LEYANSEPQRRAAFHGWEARSSHCSWAWMEMCCSRSQALCRRTKPGLLQAACMWWSRHNSSVDPSWYYPRVLHDWLVLAIINST